VSLSSAALSLEAEPADVLEADIDAELPADIEADPDTPSVSPSVPDSTGSPSFVQARLVSKDRIKIFVCIALRRTSSASAQLRLTETL
jgi:hypothetical protein